MLILASQSPRRKELLSQLHIPFTIRVADIDETMDPSAPPIEEVAKVSRKKALAVPRDPGDTVIAADTIVVVGNEVLGKPRDEADAARMLRALSGRQHQVMTGVTVLKGEAALTHTEVTDITFRTLSETDIRRYIATGEPNDKAGAYGIQGGAAIFVEAIHGDYYNVVGLPLCRLWQMLRSIAPELLEDTP